MVPATDMRQTHSGGAVMLARILVVGLWCGCDHGPDPAIGRNAAVRAAEQVQRGRASMESLVHGLQTAITHAGVVVTPGFVGVVNTARIRDRLRGLHDDQTAIGRELAFYPTWFIAAVGADGKIVAGDRMPEDNLAGRDLGASFACVSHALAGTAETCVGSFVSVDGQPPRTYLIAAAPIGNGDAGAATARAAIVGAIPFGRLARAIRSDLELRSVRDDVQLAVGFRVNGRVTPSGNDNDVPMMYLVPDSLIQKIPADADARLASRHGAFTFTFSENQGSRLWGAAVGNVPALGPAVSLVVFRTPLRQ